MQFKDIGKLFTKNILLTEILLVIFIIIVGAFGFHAIEGWRILDAFYFVVSVMTTIGFGDFTPQTDTGKIFVMIYAVIGVPLFISIGGLLLENRFKITIERYMKRVHKEIQVAEMEIQETENEIQKIERNVKKLKTPLQITEEKIENIEEKMDQKALKDEEKEKDQKNEKKSRWKKILRK